MDRLTRATKFPLDTFNRCQICGHESQNICEFRMWQECDDADGPEPGNVLIVCDKKPCKRVLDDHERLYIEVPWSAGGPGMFMIICGSCKFREGTACKHPDLKANGGEGLEVKFGQGLANAIVCCYDEKTGAHSCFTPSRPAVDCAGKSKETTK